MTKLEERAAGLSWDVFSAIPDQYLDRDPYGQSDPLAAAWNWAVNASMEASFALEHLGDLLRTKAGITEPWPYRKLCQEKSSLCESTYA
jgi:hypothetical protein